METRGIPSILIALASNPGALQQALRRRVHFTMQKPIIGDLMVRTLKAAYRMIVAEKRVSFRHSARISRDCVVVNPQARQSLPGYFQTRLTALLTRGL